MNLIKSYNLSDKINVLESQSDIVPYYSLVDVMINSRRDAEPFGLTIIESMLMEKPIIALGLGGPAETIINNHTGWLVEEASVDAYFKKIELSYLLRDTWPVIGGNGRKHALKNFTTETFLSNLMLIIEKIKNKKKI
jgi:glycosyltransferase involved in cell wall biosynthesis